MSNTISRHPGFPIYHTGLLCGSGHFGATDELDKTIARAAVMLRNAYQRDITIRFNSDRMSGGAWIVTHPLDQFTGNNQIGIFAGLYASREDLDDLDRAFPDILSRERRLHYRALPRYLRLFASIGNASLRDKAIVRSYDDGGYPDDPDNCYCHKPVASLRRALSFLKANAILRETYL